MMRVILDTSSIISYLLTRRKGNIHHIIVLAKAKKIELIISKEILSELKSKIKTNKIKTHPNFNSRNSSQFIAWYQHNAKTFDISRKSEFKELRDLSDQPFLELAVVSKADYIISGDKDILLIKQVGITRIVKPEYFLKLENHI